MSDTAIRVENLSKLYRIGGPQERYKTLRDTLAHAAVAPVHQLRRLGQPAPPQETIWALKDVSFEVKHGEVLGIIGPNGAGKTTLLRILSRITEPTTGHAEIHGRVGSLLEVGTGFHPELTGRENIYLNGAILGMRKVEIERKFDEIVAFAEIEKFLDTPVKRYSSGMYVRLAFAVAAHLEPEILLVDEVLAVGDAAFQKKCLGMIGDVAGEGRTVMFVSHNMHAVSELCETGLLLRSGYLDRDGPIADVIKSYVADAGTASRWTRGERELQPSKKFFFLSAQIVDQNGAVASHLDFGAPFVVEIQYLVARRVTCKPAFHAVNLNGVVAFSSTECDAAGGQDILREPGVYRVRCVVNPNWLMPGTYAIRLSASQTNVEHLDSVDICLQFDIGGVGSLWSLDRRPGLFDLTYEWTLCSFEKAADGYP